MNNGMSMYEVIMLLCFGAAWPVSLYKSWKSRTNAGKSLWFLVSVLTGYVAGCLHKVTYDMDPVVALYALNGLLVGADLLLYWRNARLQRARLDR